MLYSGVRVSHDLTLYKYAGLGCIRVEGIFYLITFVFITGYTFFNSFCCFQNWYTSIRQQFCKSISVVGDFISPTSRNKEQVYLDSFKLNVFFLFCFLFFIVTLKDFSEFWAAILWILPHVSVALITLKLKPQWNTYFNLILTFRQVWLLFGTLYWLCMFLSLSFS